MASTTLQEPLEWNATLLTGDVADAVANLKQQPGRDIVMYGSAGLMAALMNHDLIDEYRIWVHPLVLGTAPLRAGPQRAPCDWWKRDPSAPASSSSATSRPVNTSPARIARMRP